MSDAAPPTLNAPQTPRKRRRPEDHPAREWAVTAIVWFFLGAFIAVSIFALGAMARSVAWLAWGTNYPASVEDAWVTSTRRRGMDYYVIYTYPFQGQQRHGKSSITSVEYHRITGGRAATRHAENIADPNVTVRVVKAGPLVYEAVFDSSGSWLWDVLALWAFGLPWCTVGWWGIYRTWAHSKARHLPRSQQRRRDGRRRRR